MKANDDLDDPRCSFLDLFRETKKINKLGQRCCVCKKLILGRDLDFVGTQDIHSLLDIYHTKCNRELIESKYED